MGSSYKGIRSPSTIIIIAGSNFDINSSCKQAMHVMRMSIVECDISGVAEKDEIAVNLAAGRVTVAARSARRATVGWLIAFLQKHPNWELV